MYQNNPTKVLTGESRLSYCNLTNPRAVQEGAEPKYSVTVLIPKSDGVTKQDIDQSIQAAIQSGVASKWNGVMPPMVKMPIHDGDGVRPNGDTFGEECKGCWVMTASSKQKPQVVDISNINVELAPVDIYSGMYGRVTVNFFPYNSNGNRGIGCGLGNVLKTRDGEPLSGHTTAANDFAGLGQSVAPPVAAPAYNPQVGYTAPAQQPYAQPTTGQTPSWL